MGVPMDWIVVVGGVLMEGCKWELSLSEGLGNFVGAEVFSCCGYCWECAKKSWP